MVKEFPHYRGTLPLIGAGIAAVVALLTYAIGVRRQRTLGRRPLPEPITPRREVRLVGALVLLLIGVIAVGLFR